MLSSMTNAGGRPNAKEGKKSTVRSAGRQTEKEPLIEPSPEVLAMMNLYEVFNWIQERAWASLPSEWNKRVRAMNNRQVKAMMTIYMREAKGRKPPTLNELAKFLDMKKSAASLLVSGLAERGLVTRSVDAENRRFIRISLASGGRRLGNAIASHAGARVVRLLDALSEKERCGFSVAAAKIHERYEEEAEGDEA